MTRFKIGDRVSVNSAGHKQDGQTGTVVYESRHWGTIGVDIDESVFGFFPSELSEAGAA